MIFAEVQEGKEFMMQKAHYNKYGTTTACTVRLVQGSLNCGQKPSGNIRNLYYGDSWFASLKTAIAISEEVDAEFIGVVKNAHAGFPRTYLEQKLSTWPPGSHLVMEATKELKKYYAVGYKYNASKVICFIATEKAGHTLPGEPYVAKWVDPNGRVCMRNISRPHFISQFFKHSNQIDKHNHARQSELAIEDNVITWCGYFRLYCTYLGITVTDSWKLYRHGLGNRHKHKDITIMTFANILCKQLLHNSFNGSTNNNVQPHLPLLCEPVSIRALAFPTQIGNELGEATTISSLGNSSVRHIAQGKTISIHFRARHENAHLELTTKMTTTGIGSYAPTRRKRGKCKACRKDTPSKCTVCGHFFCDNMKAHGRMCFIEHKECMIAKELDAHWQSTQRN